MLALASCGGASEEALATPDQGSKEPGAVTTRGPAGSRTTTSTSAAPATTRSSQGSRNGDGTTAAGTGQAPGGSTTGGDPTAGPRPGGPTIGGGPGPDPGGPANPGNPGNPGNSGNPGSTAVDPSVPSAEESMLGRRDIPPGGIETQFDFLDPSGPDYIVSVAPSSGPAGTTFQVSASTANGAQDRVVVLDVYQVTRIEDPGRPPQRTWSYLNRLGSVRTGPQGPALPLVTRAGDPPGTYCVAARVERSNCREFVVT